MGLELTATLEQTLAKRKVLKLSNSPTTATKNRPHMDEMTTVNVRLWLKTCLCRRGLDREDKCGYSSISHICSESKRGGKGKIILLYRLGYCFTFNVGIFTLCDPFLLVALLFELLAYFYNWTFLVALAQWIQSRLCSNHGPGFLATCQFSHPLAVVQPRRWFLLSAVNSHASLSFQISTPRTTARTYWKH